MAIIGQVRFVHILGAMILIHIVHMRTVMVTKYSTSSDVVVCQYALYVHKGKNAY